MMAGALGVDPDDERSMATLALVADFFADIKAIRAGLTQTPER